MSDATLARMEHGKYVGVRGEPRRDGVCVIRKPTLYDLNMPRHAPESEYPQSVDDLMFSAVDNASQTVSPRAISH
jgi:hypothetical protein